MARGNKARAAESTFSGSEASSRLPEPTKEELALHDAYSKFDRAVGEVTSKGVGEFTMTVGKYAREINLKMQRGDVDGLFDTVNNFADDYDRARAAGAISPEDKKLIDAALMAAKEVPPAADLAYGKKSGGLSASEGFDRYADMSPEFRAEMARAKDRMERRKPLEEALQNAVQQRNAAYKRGGIADQNDAEANVEKAKAALKKFNSEEVAKERALTASGLTASEGGAFKNAKFFTDQNPMIAVNVKKGEHSGIAKMVLDLPKGGKVEIPRTYRVDEAGGVGLDEIERDDVYKALGKAGYKDVDPNVVEKIIGADSKNWAWRALSFIQSQADKKNK